MCGSAANALQQQGMCDERLGVLVGICHAHEQSPTVINQRDGARAEPATLQISREKAALIPSVFQFTKPVLAIRAIAILLRDGYYFIVERDDDDGAFASEKISVRSTRTVQSVDSSRA